MCSLKHHSSKMSSDRILSNLFFSFFAKSQSWLNNNHNSNNKKMKRGKIHLIGMCKILMIKVNRSHNEDHNNMKDNFLLSRKNKHCKDGTLPQINIDLMECKSKLHIFLFNCYFWNLIKLIKLELIKFNHKDKCVRIVQ